MRKVTQLVCTAFEGKYPKSVGNTHTDGETLYLHGNAIAQWRDGDLFITNSGWASVTTKERLNGLDGVSINQKDYTWYLNGKQWDGEWVSVHDFTAPDSECNGCNMHIEGEPALSRYNHGDICSRCGVGEALLGDFITQRRAGAYSR